MNQLIGNQGGAGSYHEAVTLAHLGLDVAPDIVPYRTFGEMFTAARAGKVGKFFMAIYNNSIEGNPFINDPYAMLMSDSATDFYVVGEASLYVKHQLWGLEDATLEDIANAGQVHTQEPAKAQCVNYLQTVLPEAEYVGREDTALSAKFVSEQRNKSYAAIASRAVGSIYPGLKILDANIQDNQDNTTRFLIVEKREDQEPLPTDDRSIIRLRTDNATGSLVQALEQFARLGINIDQLHSAFRPTAGFKPQFYMEIEVGQADPRVRELYACLERMDVGVTVLGSYRSNPVPYTAHFDLETVDK